MCTNQHLSVPHNAIVDGCNYLRAYYLQSLDCNIITPSRYTFRIRGSHSLPLFQSLPCHHYLWIVLLSTAAAPSTPATYPQFFEAPCPRMFCTRLHITRTIITRWSLRPPGVISICLVPMTKEDVSQESRKDECTST